MLLGSYKGQPFGRASACGHHERARDSNNYEWTAAFRPSLGGGGESLRPRRSTGGGQEEGEHSFRVLLLWIKLIHQPLDLHVCQLENEYTRA